MKFERFKNLDEMSAFIKSHPKMDMDYGVYPEGGSYRPQVILYGKGAEDICLRWYAFSDQPDIDHYGPRARRSANIQAEGMVQKLLTLR